MGWINPLRHHISGLILSGLGLFGPLILIGSTQDRQLSGLMADAAELAAPAGAPVTRFDFEEEGVGDWKTLEGQWAVEEMPDAPNGRRVLLQHATQNAFNAIVWPGAFYRNVDISVRFKPLSGREDASGGIVFRFTAGKYYVVRANALENNLRLYYYDRERHLLATASVRPPAIRQWHTLRVVAVGDQIQGWLDGALLIDHRDKRLEWGEVGLWTKADSVTAFDDLTIRGFRSALSM
jgi:hypothetical protein